MVSIASMQAFLLLVKTTNKALDKLINMLSEFHDPSNEMENRIGFTTLDRLQSEEKVLI